MIGLCSRADNHRAHHVDRILGSTLTIFEVPSLEIEEHQVVFLSMKKTRCDFWKPEQGMEL